MTAFDETTRKNLLATLIQLEERLRELARAADEQALASPLPVLRDDRSTEQQRMLADGARQLRAAMRELMQRHGLEPPEPQGSAAQACLRALHTAQAAVEHLAPTERNDGSRTADEVQADLHRVMAQLLAPLDAMRDALAPPDDDQEGAGKIPQDLQALRRIVRAHGLTQFESRLHALIERANAPDFVIAVFGQTNAGKSSLVNRLLDTDLLPTGATSITAVPIRLHHGPQARAVAHFARGAPEVITRDELIELASERYNTANRKRVIRLDYAWPAPRLAGGVCLLDTPGWLPGAALPPCDVGLVLIDASSSLNLPEAALIDALREAGTAVVVLLTKADRLDEQDRWDVLGRVTALLRIGADSPTPVFLASTVAQDEELRSGWITRGLEPLIARRAALRAASLQRKTQRLRADIARSLERLGQVQPPEALAPQIANARRAGERLIANARTRSVTPEVEARTLAQWLLREVAHNAAALNWQDHAAGMALAPMIDASLHARVDSLRHDLVRRLELVAAECADRIAELHGPASGWQVPTASLPILDSGALPASLAVARPVFGGFGPWLVRPYLRWMLRRRRVPTVLQALLADHLDALERWRQSALDELDRAFAAACDACLEAAAQPAPDLESDPDTRTQPEVARRSKR